jgi:hypothetical protein
VFYRIVGVSTGLGMGVLLAILVSVSSGLVSAGKTSSMFAVVAGGCAVAIGLLTMIWHLNFRQGSESVRNEWRNYLTYLGPVAAAVYLYRVAPLAHGARAVGSQLVSPVLVVGLSVGALAMTVLAARNLPPSELLAPQEAALNYLLRLGGMVGLAGVAAAVGMQYWSLILWMLVPSFVALYLGSQLSVEAGIGLLGAGLTLTWSVATIIRRFVPPRSF